MEICWDLVGNISSVATLVLFVFYFIGRLWSVHINRKLSYEKIEAVYQNCEDIDPDTLDAMNPYDINGDELLKIVSGQYLNWIKVYSFNFRDDKYLKIKKTNLLEAIFDINIDEPIYLKVFIPEGVPDTLIEFQRYDYVIGQFIIRFDGRGTGYTAKDFKFRNTLRTYLYYLVK